MKNLSHSLQEINAAYELMKEVDCLDLSKEGTEAWDSAVKRYFAKIKSFLSFKLLIPA